MSTTKLEAKCPGCGHEVTVNADLPDAKVVVQEDTAKLNALSRDLAESRQSLDALRGEVQRWQSGENHLTADDMLNMLQSCPNCRPTLEAFVAEQQKRAVAGLLPEQVKEIARAQKWWPPPPIELVPGLSRKARS